MKTKLCKYCRQEIDKKAKICPHCQKKQKGKGGLIFLIIVIIIIIVIIAAALGGSEDDGTITNPDSQTEISSDEEVSDDAEAEDDGYVYVGGTYEKDGLAITLTDYNDNFTVEDDEYGYYTPSEGMKYIKASFTYENNGDSDAYVSIYDFDCYADGTTCEQKYLDDSDFINTNLSSGRNVSFDIYFEVPESAESVELEYTYSIFSDTTDVIFKLQ